ncbi:helix-turn-helix domain-containing protein [Mitsuokella multacida]|uniref:helix-turn-helix domain-containing protein n=1 Tax=Mitsuokella multacida TaxID=52226 RepID=UPI0039F5E628
MTEHINNRIRTLRKKLHLNQAEFGEKIGLKNGAISWMEKEGNNVTDQNIQLICEKFQVRRDWLVDGTGEMFAERTKKDELMEWAERVSQSPHDSFPYRLAEVLAKLDEPQWKMLEQIFDKIMAEGNTENSNVAKAEPTNAEAAPPDDDDDDPGIIRRSYHRQLDQALDSEEKAASASSYGNSGTISRFHKK